MNANQDRYHEAQKLQQAQRFAEAEAIYRRIVESEPNHIGAWFLLGMVCLAQQKHVEGMEGLQRTVQLSPSHVEAHTQLGLVLARQHRLPEALNHFRRAVELQPENAKAQNNMGVVLVQLGRRDEAHACYGEAARLQPDYAEAHFNLALSLVDRRQKEEAIASYRRALQARPDYPDALRNLGMLLVDERRPGEAVIYLEQAVRLEPENAIGYNNLCLALCDVGRFAEAVVVADAGLRLRPFDPKTLMNRGNALTGLGRLDEAIASYDLALTLQPDYGSGRWNRSLAWLTKGDYQRGWAEYEWRWKRPETPTRNFPEPLWDGKDLKGRAILLWCEQGLGDTIQFIRYAPILKLRGAAVWLECPSKMIPLLSKCSGIDRLLPEGSPLPAGFDCQAPLMSMPYLCGTTLSTVPSDSAYLAADADQEERWKAELTSPKLKIGVAWQGNPRHRFDHHRSFSIQWLRNLALLGGVELYSLQKGKGVEQLEDARFPIVDLGKRLDENDAAFVETAAAMRSLDLVITCDSALAHLAGALGVPVWVALTSSADWRWMLDREDTPWYPSMRLFRQATLGDWRPVFERIRDEVIQLRDAASSPTLQLEVAPGELLDKLTILQIKSERIRDPEKLRNVRSELGIVEATHRERIREAPGLTELVAELKEINECLWDIENRIRDCEKAEDFGDEFIALARSVYQTNDRRAAVKKRINELLGAKFREEKDYHGQ